MRIEIPKTRINFYFISLILILFPMNIDLAASIRPVDLVILMFFIYRLFNENRHTDKNILIISLVFFIFMLASVIYGFFFRPLLNFTNIFFLLKYAFPFMLYFSIKNSELSNREIKLLFYLFALMFLFMLVWTLLYQLLKLRGLVRGSWRTSYPFTRASSGSDAHMLSAYFSFHIVLMYICWKKHLLKMNAFFFSILLGLSFGAMLITGSRNGIVSIAICVLIIWWITRPGRRGAVYKHDIALLAILLIVLFLGIMFISSRTSGLFTSEYGIKSLIERATKLDFNDNSASFRLLKFSYAFEETLSGPAIIGIGAITSKMGWYDGSIASLLANSGFGGFFVFIILIYTMLKKNHAKGLLNKNEDYTQIYFILFINYIISNLITEFFLVTRGMVFAVFMLAMLDKVTATESFNIKLFVFEKKKNENINYNPVL